MLRRRPLRSSYDARKNTKHFTVYSETGGQGNDGVFAGVVDHAFAVLILPVESNVSERLSLLDYTT